MLKEIVAEEYGRAVASLKRGESLVINARKRLRRARSAMKYLKMEENEK
jgi:hypothetical protein